MALPIIYRGDVDYDDPHWVHFSASPISDAPPTPDRLTPDIRFYREFDHYDMDMPDGEEVRFWVFRTEEGEPHFPSDVIRCTEGQIVHTTIKPHTGPHTIHHHGIEPTTMNDGVGKLSFEANGEYTYQWLAGAAGTYFYHCHRNTVLHFEMGLYGLLIIDPPTDPNDPPGTKRAFTGGPIYDVEAFWVPDEVDPRWHEMSHGAGLGRPFGNDVGLNRFNPKYFLITGVPTPRTATDPRVAINAQLGQTILIRLLNAGYTIQRYTIYGLDAQVIAMDGRAMGVPPFNHYSQPFTIPAGTPFELTTARRYDLLIKPTVKGTYRATVDYIHWINGKVLHTAETFIRVN